MLKQKGFETFRIKVRQLRVVLKVTINNIEEKITTGLLKLLN